MKSSMVKMVLLATAAGVILLTGLAGLGIGEEKENIWADDEPGYRQRQFELTDERIERMMDRLAEAEPAKAKELAKLREEDPRRFRAELRRIIRQRVGGKRGPRMQPGERPGPGAQRFQAEHERPFKGPGRMGQEGRFGPMMARHRQRFSEFVEWLGENYPEQAQKFEEWQQQRGPHEGRPMPPGAGAYMRIFEAWKESPQLAEVLKEDLELKKQRGSLLRKIKRSKDDNEKQELAKQLKQVLSARFDLLVRRKQIEYEQLRARLEELRKRVEESAAEVAKWKDGDFKNENVDARLKELVGGVEKFKWE